MRWRLGGALATVVLLGLGFGLLASQQSSPRKRPKLAILLIFDQMRGDFLDRWRDLYGKDGLRRLTDEGAWFNNCHYPFAMTMTGPGHATCATGCSPDVHGIAANEWYDRDAGREQYCVSAVRYTQVPPALSGGSSEKGKLPSGKLRGISPETLLAPTLGDALKQASNGKGKVVALSLKDRGAVLPAGKKPDAVYWVDSQGRLVTSTYYRDRVHPWVEEINQSTLALTWLNSRWDKLRPDLDYEKYSGPDDAQGEGKGYFQGVTFPHLFDGGPKKLLSAYYAALANSPQGNEYLLEVTKRAIVAEKLGQRDEPDLLSVSFSSNDLVGHCWGPDSQEVLDITLRSDLIVRDLLVFLDKTVGKDNYVIALSADHGICPLPEVARAAGKKAARVSPQKFFTALEEHLNAHFPSPIPPADEQRPTKGWIEAAVSNMIYLNRKRAADRKVSVTQVADEVVRWLRKQPEVMEAFTYEQLRQAEVKSPLGQRVLRSFHPERSGEVTVVLQPYHFFSSQWSGTTHGSPHDYDTHVPLVIYGPQVRPGLRKQRVSPEAAAVILAEALGIPGPAKAAVGVPAGLWR